MAVRAMAQAAQDSASFRLLDMDASPGFAGLSGSCMTIC
jgi:hypothetical protein